MTPTATTLAEHVTRRRILGGLRWQAVCSCGWISRGLRWPISADDAAAGHLLDAEGRR